MRRKPHFSLRFLRPRARRAGSHGTRAAYTTSRWSTSLISNGWACSGTISSRGSSAISQACPFRKPIVAFAHVPLYALYPQWGWTTADGAKALAMLARFDAVTVLNGHIHQVIEHAEGNIRFATANSTAYPQPAPGAADKPGPKMLPHDQLLHVIGYRTVDLNGGDASLRNVTLG